MSRFILFWLFALLILDRSPVRANAEANSNEAPVVATVESSLPTADDNIRQLAFDGDAATSFVSATNPAARDHFTIAFEKPVALGSIAVTTGRADGRDALDSGAVEISSDGKAFEQVATFTDGMARLKQNARQVLAVRITATADSPHPLIVRELAIDSQPPVARFQYPVEFVVDVSDATEMKGWAENTARICERAYPMINEELKSDGYRPPRLVWMALKSDYKGVAEASGDHIVGGVQFFKQHSDDVGVVQHYYRSRRNPGWLVEGVADYVRFFKFEPGNLGKIDAQRAHYNGSYRVSAAFLAYLVEKYDQDLVRKLNTLMRAGEYRDEVFKELTGKNLDALDEEWRATLAN
jgi:hypothetical protein